MTVRPVKKLTKNRETVYLVSARKEGKKVYYVLPKEYNLRFKSKREAKQVAKLLSGSYDATPEANLPEELKRLFTKVPCGANIRLGVALPSMVFGRRKKMSAKAKKLIAKARAFGRRRKASFGRKRRTSRRKSSFGRKRKSSFGKKRRHRRRHRKHDDEMSFGRRRRRRSTVEFGKKRRRRRHPVVEFGRRRRRASFGLSLSRPMNYGFSRFL